MLFKSKLHYKDFKNTPVVQLLPRLFEYYDEMGKKSVKCLQWKILSRRVTLFDEILKNPEFLEEVLEAVFLVGSLNLLKYVLTKVKENKFNFYNPVLVNAVYIRNYVKIENLQKFRDCFDYALEYDQHNLAARDKLHGATALHFANGFRYKRIIKDLLEKKPPIAIC